ncbi:hypothetical protein [Variovorax paradoxus]|uniref:hypothetical protein n=1 Tax=Variovorax paradoxus TaxID=34073 RepID=UPI00018C12F6|nr:hypothetical protein [Variovorax paradoxus]
MAAAVRATSAAFIRRRRSTAALFVCLSAETGLDLDTQRALFAAALDIIERQALDLVNRALELFLLADGTLEYSIYELPAPGTAGIAGVYRARTSFQLMYLDQIANGSL